jgi:hypothetical protein
MSKPSIVKKCMPTTPKVNPEISFSFSLGRNSDIKNAKNGQTINNSNILSMPSRF